MSYILDALRKSDEERRRGSTPTLLTPQIAAEEAARPKTFAYGIAAVVILVVGVVIGALAPWQGDAPPAPAKPVAVAPASPAVPPATAASAERAAPVPQVLAAKPAAPAPKPVAAPQREPVAPARTAPRRSERSQEIAAAKPAPQAPPKPPERKPVAAPEKSQPPVVAFGDLPLAIQQEMPKLQVAAHAYSSVAGDRLVSINERIVREGDTVASGLVLEEITPSGMILSYRGYRFRRSAR